LAAAGGAGLGGGGAAMRGGGGAGAAIRAGGGGALTLGGGGGAAVTRGGGGGAARRGGGGDGEAIRGCGGGVGRDTLGGGGGGVRAADGALGGGFGIEVTLGLGGTPAGPAGGVVATVDPTLGGGPAGPPGGFGPPTAAGAFVAGNLATPAPAGAFGGAVDDGAVPCCGPGGVTSLALGLPAPGAPVAALGGGGAPFVPGTGNAFARGKGWPCGASAGALAGCTFGAAVPVGPAGLMAGLIEALGGTGALPCWISVARCATEGGNAGPAAPGAATGSPPLAPGGMAAPSGPRWPGAKPGCGERLITLLMTVVLWMLAKMMLFGGGAT